MAEKKKPAKKTIEKGTSISGCTFVGVMFDEKAVDAVTTLASGLLENARALGVLARVLNGSNVKIETMIEVK